MSGKRFDVRRRVEDAMRKVVPASEKKRLQKALDSKSIVSIPDTRILPAPPAYHSPTQQPQCQINVLQCDTWQCVALLQTQCAVDRVLVLDFASDTNAGGGWLGGQQGTQEEHLCRTSSLGLQLESVQDSAYPVNMFGAIYIPQVFVFDVASPFWCSVVAAALRGGGGASKEYLQQKIDGVFRVLIAYGHRVLILGAWGCGAFGTDADEVAACFKTILKCYEHCLDYVVFAIKGKIQFKVFSEVFL
ncbi:hypothetical protein HK100_004730 [Physocladia obscura]|uniref:Microbial-type PARG catalytic domain-containing protein n=1 Tax=Physocladia obscura TaxID=109957 RepID=A0AAD5T8P0_9FUNG|nr:hypothetical protein HK100_004730 [Physocladia obscura]